jgi:hypothetical protein
MSFSFSLSDLWAGIALVVSMYAAQKTIKFNERQKSLIESQERLNELLLTKEKTDSLTAKKADLGVGFIKLGSSNYRLKIWNKGKAPAKDVRVSFPEGNEIISKSELANKFPLESLETHQSVELIAFVHMQTKSKHTVSLTCDVYREESESLSPQSLANDGAPFSIPMEWSIAWFIFYAFFAGARVATVTMPPGKKTKSAADQPEPTTLAPTPGQASTKVDENA